MKYYAAHGMMTDPGQYVDLYADLPSQVPELCKVVQGNLIHVFHAHRHGVELSETKKEEAGIRKVEDMLKRIRATDPRPLRFAREPEKRLAANCRGFAVMLCSVLRHKGIPARARCGFETYHDPAWHLDHWVCQYWNAKEKRWVWVDAQVDSLQREAFRLEFDPCDMPAGKFLPAGKVWQLCQAGKVDPDHCGFPPELHGLWFVKDNVIRDFLALNRFELLPWDNTVFTAKGDEEVTAQETKWLDRMAELSAAPEDKFEHVRSLYDEANSMLQMPAEWKP